MAFIIAILAILGIVAYAVKMNSDNRSTRIGTETMDAADVVDLVVQAQTEYEANGATY